MFWIALLLIVGSFIYANISIFPGQLIGHIGSAIAFGLIVSILFTIRILYRPKDNHIGAVYRFGRFSYFVGPNEIDLLLPFEKVGNEYSLGLRQLEAALENVMTQDGVLINMCLNVQYWVDLREAENMCLNELLVAEDSRFAAFVESKVIDLGKNFLIPFYTYNELGIGHKRSEFQGMMRYQLTMELESMGIFLSQECGVIITAIHAPKNVEILAQECATASWQGHAAKQRVMPLLKMTARTPHAARDALLLAMTSRIVDGATLPTYPMPPMQGSNASAYSDRLLNEEDPFQLFWDQQLTPAFGHPNTDTPFNPSSPDFQD